MESCKFRQDEYCEIHRFMACDGPDFWFPGFPDLLRTSGHCMHCGEGQRMSSSSYLVSPGFRPGRNYCSKCMISIKEAGQEAFRAYQQYWAEHANEHKLLEEEVKQKASANDYLPSLLADRTVKIFNQKGLTKWVIYSYQVF